MNKLPFLLFVFFLTGCALFPNSAEVPATDSYTLIAPVLDSAETFFISLKERKYGTAWDLLSERSQKRIINDVYKASKKDEAGLEEEAIKIYFEKRDLLFNSYWDAFLTEFDPDMVLKESHWKMGPVKKNEAEIIILHKTSKNPAIIRMFKENGLWKVGFSESFSTENSEFHKEF